jgi:predicted AAA+ superfamily ATPase
VLDNYLVVVILSGARQTGKTTLARSAEIGADRDYRTMDEFSTL